jgi:DNA-binding LacI/PurR family transcriptional regulator
VKSRLESLPTVWLMANPHRPAWGDQVMPDNSAIGAMAARYLLERGHRRLAYLGTRASWSLELRSLAFAHAAAEAGVHADVLETPEPQTGDFWQRDGLDSAASVLAARLATLAQAPTGLFIAEDRLVPMVDAAMKALRAAHNGNGGGGDGGGNGNVYPHGAVDIISCNNERAHFNRLNFVPATIDIRAEAIGRLGVERLIWRLSNTDLPERIRCMVEPRLVEA